MLFTPKVANHQHLKHLVADFGIGESFLIATALVPRAQVAWNSRLHLSIAGAFDGPRGDLGPGGEAELGQHVLDMALSGARRDE
ncbi:hypothetical protein BDB13_3936 [Rhodococcus sp. OK302]|nr:hypothetical protein BDB13_3936 [Rhodococcus sp. OK302]